MSGRDVDQETTARLHVYDEGRSVQQRGEQVSFCSLFGWRDGTRPESLLIGWGHAVLPRIWWMSGRYVSFSAPTAVFRCLLVGLHVRALGCSVPHIFGYPPVDFDVQGTWCFDVGRSRGSGARWVSSGFGSESGTASSGSGERFRSSSGAGFWTEVPERSERGRGADSEAVPGPVPERFQRKVLETFRSGADSGGRWWDSTGGHRKTTSGHLKNPVLANPRHREIPSVRKAACRTPKLLAPNALQNCSGTLLRNL